MGKLLNLVILSLVIGLLNANPTLRTGNNAQRPVPISRGRGLAREETQSSYGSSAPVIQNRPVVNTVQTVQTPSRPIVNTVLTVQTPSRPVILQQSRPVAVESRPVAVESRPVESNSYGAVQTPVRPVVQQQRPRPVETVTPVLSYGPTPVRDVPRRPILEQPIVTPVVAPVRPVVPETTSYGNDFLLQNTPVDTPLFGACASNPCLNEATCINTNDGGYRCQCPWGWEGQNCQICLTECKSNPCPLNKKCRAIYGGGYECICPSDRTGFNCEIQNDACSPNPCINGGVCVAQGSSGYTCTCTMPFSGTNCEELFSNPCTEEVLRAPEVIHFRSPWRRDHYIICADVDQWIEMRCSEGTFFNEQLGHCVPEGYEPPMCPPSYCKNDGECVLDDYNQLQCKCKAGFTGLFCEENIDECALNNYACNGGYCVDSINSYYCVCAGERIGLSCETAIPNPCMDEKYDAESVFFELPSIEGDLYLQCTGIGTLSLSRCASGLFWNQEEKTCTMEKPELKSGICQTYPCKNGGNCVDLGYSQYKCECKTGYTGQLCEEMIDFCASNPCQNGGRCLPYAGGYTCVCPEKIIDECCCNGIINPCPEKSKLVPGVNNYFPHLFPNKYIHCDFDGRAFVRTCMDGLRWNQEVLSCLPVDFILNKTEPVVQQDSIQISYGAQPMQPRPIVLQPVVQRPVEVVPQPSRDQTFRRPAVQPGYGAQLPVETTTTTTTTTPVPALDLTVQTGYGAQPIRKPVAPIRDLPVRRPVVQTGYGAQLPVETTTTTRTTTPTRDLPVPSGYGAQPVRDLIRPVVPTGYDAPQTRPTQRPLRLTSPTTTTTVRPILDLQPGYGAQPNVPMRDITRPVVQPGYGAQSSRDWQRPVSPIRESPRPVMQSALPVSSEMESETFETPVLMTSSGEDFSETQSNVLRDEPAMDEQQWQFESSDLNMDQVQFDMPAEQTSFNGRIVETQGIVDTPRVQPSAGRVVEQSRIQGQGRVVEQTRVVEQPRIQGQGRVVEQQRLVEQPRIQGQGRVFEQPRLLEEPRVVEQPRVQQTNSRVNQQAVQLIPVQNQQQLRVLQNLGRRTIN